MGLRFEALVEVEAVVEAWPRIMEILYRLPRLRSEMLVEGHHRRDRCSVRVRILRYLRHQMLIRLVVEGVGLLLPECPVTFPACV